MIPKKLHFIWITKDFMNEDNTLKDWHYKVLKSYEKHNKDYKIITWTNKDIRNLITLIPKNIQNIILDEKTLLAQKTDILRIFILKIFGGIYVDFDTICLDNFDDLLINNFFVGMEKVKEYTHQSYLRVCPEGYYINNAVIGSRKNSSVLKTYISLLPYTTNKLRISYGPNLIETCLFLIKEKLSIYEYIILPEDFFYTKNYHNKFNINNLTKNTKIIHFYTGTSKNQNKFDY